MQVVTNVLENLIDSILRVITISRHNSEHHIFTEQRSWVVSTPVGPGLKYRHKYRLSRLSFLWFSSIPPGKFHDSTSI